ncbi:MAG: hypothetical protein KI793_13195 [Rivularia sp. (in: Bacteria)]|nr:hypothetical protein [Rivularia sp. MS3]
MSYQFSFLQVFAGYDFVGSRLFATLNRNELLQSLRRCLRVDFYRQIETLLLVDTSKHSIHICYRLKFFRQMFFNCFAIKYATLDLRWLYRIGEKFKPLQTQYSWHFRQHLKESSSDCNRSYIFDNYIAKFLCKYLLRVELSKNKKIALWEGSFTGELHSLLKCKAKYINCLGLSR